jgi:phosphomannomutase
MARLREQPPSSLGGLAVLQLEDLAQGTAQLPPTDGLRFTLADRARVIVRPSGTEPKVKCYLEVVVPVEARTEDPEDTAVDAARIAAVGRLDAIRADVQLAAGL